MITLFKPRLPVPVERPCVDPRGHRWVRRVEGSGSHYCERCKSDGDLE